MPYRRVLPRDLFNEAGLLKAVGRVVILLGSTPYHHARFACEDVDQFRIEQDENSGAIRIVNVPFLIGNQQWVLERPLNSRASWSLTARLPDYTGNTYEVFTATGNFTPEFLALILGRHAHDQSN